MIAVEQERRGAARRGLEAALQHSRVSRLRRRLNDLERRLQDQLDLVARTSAEIHTAGRLVRTDDEARAKLALYCRRDTARREASRLLALRDVNETELGLALDGAA